MIMDPTPNPQTTSQMSGGGGAGMMRLTQRGADSFSQNSKSMTKFSDNGSEGSYHPKNVEKYKTTKQSQLVPQNSGGLNDLKIENSKNHTFASDLEDSPSIQGLTGTNLVRVLNY